MHTNITNLKGNRKFVSVFIFRARFVGRINNDPGVQTILNEISAIRKGLTGVQYYDTLSVPLVYTQVNIRTNELRILRLVQSCNNHKISYSVG